MTGLFAFKVVSKDVFLGNSELVDLLGVLRGELAILKQITVVDERELPLQITVQSVSHYFKWNSIISRFGQHREVCLTGLTLQNEQFVA